jgi:hypothetical protein
MDTVEFEHGGEVLRCDRSKRVAYLAAGRHGILLLHYGSINAPHLVPASVKLRYLLNRHKVWMGLLHGH